jgi:hypothetical protein
MYLWTMYARHDRDSSAARRTLCVQDTPPLHPPHLLRARLCLAKHACDEHGQREYAAARNVPGSRRRASRGTSVTATLGRHGGGERARAARRRYIGTHGGIESKRARSFAQSVRARKARQRRTYPGRRTRGRRRWPRCTARASGRR